MLESSVSRPAVRGAPRGFLKEAGVEGRVGAEILAGIDEAKLPGPSV